MIYNISYNIKELYKTHDRAIMNRGLTFQQARELQKAIISGKSIPDAEPCTPVISREGSPDNHFFDDKSKFHVCLPTKTGSTNWLKMLWSLYKFDGMIAPEKVDANMIYQISQMPRFQELVKNPVFGSIT